MNAWTVSKPIPAADARGKYAPRLRELLRARVSGVYAIIDARTGKVLYVGESHTDRLGDTLTRHFRRWKIDPENDSKERRRGGTTYARGSSLVMWMVTPRAEAADAQYRMIEELNPRDNSNDCRSCPPF